MVSTKANKAYHESRQAEKDGDNERKKALMEQRKQEIGRLAQLRKEQLQADENLQLTREQLYANVSNIIVSHICEAHRLIPEPTEGAKLFHEYNFMPHKWTI